MCWCYVYDDDTVRCRQIKTNRPTARFSNAACACRTCYRRYIWLYVLICAYFNTTILYSTPIEATQTFALVRIGAHHKIRCSVAQFVNMISFICIYVLYVNIYLQYLYVCMYVYKSMQLLYATRIK